MKKVLLFVSMIATGLFSTIGQAMAAEGNPKCPSININVLGMEKQLSSDWKPNDLQDELGASLDLRPATWPLAIEVGYLYATKKGNANTIITSGNTSTAYNNLQTQAITEEAFAGLKKNWTNAAGWNLFVSAGASWIKGSLQFANVGNFDSSQVGWYASLGGGYVIANFLELGVIGRYSNNTVNVIGRDINAGGLHYGVYAGIHI